MTVSGDPESTGNEPSLEPYKKGDLTEAIVIAELTRRDIPVSIPFGDNERYDLLAETHEGTVVRLQVKTGKVVDGTVRFSGKSPHTNAQGTTNERYEGDVDQFVVYCYSLESMYLIAESEVGTSMRLRVVDPAHDHPSINWADEYLFDRVWPSGKGRGGEERSEQISTHRRGDATEAHVISEFLGRDIPIAVPPSDNERYDLVAHGPDGRFYRLQIKTAQFNGRQLRCKAYSNHVNASGNVYKPYEDDIDFFLVYSPDLDGMYLIGENEVETAIRLWVDEPEQIHPGTKWADDFAFDRRWPPEGSPVPEASGGPPRKSVGREAVIGALHELAIPTSQPVDGDSSFDLLAETPTGESIALSIRTARVRDGRLFFHADDDHPPEAYLLYCPDLDQVYAIASHAFDTSISLWVDEPEEIRRTTRWAADFELERNWPPRRVYSSKSPVGAGIAALESAGAEVSIPTDGEFPYHLLAGSSDGVFRRIAVETGWIWNGRIRLKPASKEGIDCFLLYCRALERAYLIRADEFDVSISLRVEPADHDDGTINWADDYRVEERWPDVGA